MAFEEQGLKFARVVLNFFGVGRIPKAPGTVASAVACAVFVPISLAPEKFQLFFLALFLLFCFFVSRYIPKIWDSPDPSEVVLDEVLGMFVALFSVDYEFWILSFLFFRVFDIFKVPPVNFFDEMGSFWAVMADDLVAGLMANFSVHAVTYLLF